MFKILILFLSLINFAFSELSEEEFILENMEMLENLEMLESEVDLEELDTDMAEQEEPAQENENEA